LRELLAGNLEHAPHGRRPRERRDGGGDAVLGALEDLLDDVLFRREMKIERAAADAGASHDVIDPRGGEAVTTKAVGRAIAQSPARPLALPIARRSGDMCPSAGRRGGRKCRRATGTPADRALRCRLPKLRGYLHA